jgi:hypothetical protein
MKPLNRQRLLLAFPRRARSRKSQRNKMNYRKPASTLHRGRFPPQPPTTRKKAFAVNPDFLVSAKGVEI